MLLRKVGELCLRSVRFGQHLQTTKDLPDFPMFVTGHYTRDTDGTFWTGPFLAPHQECLRARQWLLLRMNGRIWEHGIPLMCRSAENAEASGLLKLHVPSLVQCRHDGLG